MSDIALQVNDRLTICTVAITEHTLMHKLNAVRRIGRPANEDEVAELVKKFRRVKGSGVGE